MRIVSRRGAVGSAEMKLGIVQTDGQNFVYFLPAGAAKAQLNAPHFVIKSGIMYGDLVGHVEFFSGAIAEFVCPDFANHEELKALRIEYDRLKTSQITEQELEALRADRAELELYRADERERVQLKARQTALDTPRDKRPKGV